MDTVFSIEESLKFGWEKTKQHSFVLFQVMLTLFALNVVHAIIERVLHDTLIGSLAQFAITVVGIVLGTGLAIMTLKIARGQAVQYRDIVPDLMLVWNVLLASLLAGILTLGGFILLIVPGVYFALRFSMVRYAVIDGAGVMESLERSTNLTNGHKWNLLWFLLVIVLLNIVGVILFMVGLLITVPVTMIAYAFVYEKLKAKAPALASVAHTHDHSHEGHDHSHEGHDHSDPNHTH